VGGAWRGMASPPITPLFWVPTFGESSPFGQFLTRIWKTPCHDHRGYHRGRPFTSPRLGGPCDYFSVVLPSFFYPRITTIPAAYHYQGRLDRVDPPLTNETYPFVPPFPPYSLPCPGFPYNRQYICFALTRFRRGKNLRRS